MIKYRAVVQEVRTTEQKHPFNEGLVRGADTSFKGLHVLQANALGWWVGTGTFSSSQNQPR